MDRRVKKTKQAIRDAFLTLIKTNSINKIKVSEVAELADINRKTFYLHYVDIYAVEEEIFEEFTSQADTLKEYLTLSKMIYCDEDFVDVLFSKLAMASEMYKDVIGTRFFQKLMRCTIEHLRETLITEYISNGGTQVKKVSYAYTFFAHGIVELFLEWVVKESKEDQKIIKQLLSDFLDFDYISQIAM